MPEVFIYTANFTNLCHMNYFQLNTTWKELHDSELMHFIILLPLYSFTLARLVNETHLPVIAYMLCKVTSYAGALIR